MIRTGVAPFDCLASGIPEASAHLLYGELGTGKSSFALHFLHWGLSRGEMALLVSRRAGRDVLQQADALGLSLRTFLRSGQLLLLEYTPDVVERAARSKNFSQITDEILYFVSGHRMQRMVFDPLVPIIQAMNVSEKAFQVRTLVQRVSAFQPCCLVLLDLPEAADLVAISKDIVQGVLRFEGSKDDTESRSLVVERLPGAPDGPRRIHFQVKLGLGIAEAARGSSVSASNGHRKILVAAKDPAVLQPIRQAVGRDYDLVECSDAIQAVARVAAECPDLFIVDADLENNHAVQACLELRRNQLNFPILAIGNTQKRLRDRLSLLAQGIDECLEKPVDGRLLHVRIRTLLKRYSARDRFLLQVADETVLASLNRPAPAAQILSDPEAIVTSLREEIEYARDHAVLFSVCLLDVSTNGGGGLGPPMETIQRLVRPHDRIAVNCHSVAVLLPETNASGAQAFLRRVEAAYPLLESGQAHILTTDGSVDFLPQVLEALHCDPRAAGYPEACFEST